MSIKDQTGIYRVFLISVKLNNYTTHIFQAGFFSDFPWKVKHRKPAWVEGFICWAHPCNCWHVFASLPVQMQFPVYLDSSRRVSNQCDGLWIFSVPARTVSHQGLQRSWWQSDCQLVICQNWLRRWIQFTWIFYVSVWESHSNLSFPWSQQLQRLCGNWR